MYFLTLPKHQLSFNDLKPQLFFCHNKYSLALSIIGFLLLMLPTMVLAKPALQLANNYEKGASLKEYWVSEKYDGVRAYWNGENLLSRGGLIINAPAELLTELPKQPLDGELWLGRQTFDAMSGLARKKAPTPDAWQDVQYIVFDLPKHTGTFAERYAAMLELHARSTQATAQGINSGINNDTNNIINSANHNAHKNGFWQVVPQFPIKDHAELEQRLATIEANGGEGLMLRRIASHHKSGRNDDLLKVKSFQDAEAIVIGHKPGKGKYLGMMGALKVQAASGHTFYIGTGFSDTERANPPAIGTTITYKYFGLTSSGKPRFASFMRIRPTDE